ncbi:MAG: hypothetical protein MR346_05035, partial [Clostridium sp.]|nr:hypothetical protein [Clostridium sp.]
RSTYRRINLFNSSIGTPLTIEELNRLIDKNKGITCVCLLGGDGNIRDINNIAQYIHTHKSNLKVCWYSGNTEISNELNKEYFDYIKYGPYIENLGPLNCKTTNQKFLEKRGDSWIDVTYKFQGVGII